MQSSRIHLTNREDLEDFSIRPDWHRNRERGVSALLRVKNEAEFIKPCLLSIKDFFDEIIIALNLPEDGTAHIIRSLDLPAMRIFEYPFDLHPNGPGHNRIPSDSVHDSAYYYNWALGKTRFSHVCKWDGDMVALPELDRKLKKSVLACNLMLFRGINLSGDAFGRLSKKAPYTGLEPRFFRVSPATFYKQGEQCEVFSHSYTDRIISSDKPLFLHFKHAKPEKSATQIWPKDWRDLQVFRQLHQRRETGECFSGVFPDQLKDHIIARALPVAAGTRIDSGVRESMAIAGDIMFGLRKSGLRGNVLVCCGQHALMPVFLSRIMETLFPDSRLVVLDAHQTSTAAPAVEQRGGRAATAVFPREDGCFTVQNAFRGISDLAFSYIDGRTIREGFEPMFRALYEKMIGRGIIVVGFDEGAVPASHRVIIDHLKKNCGSRAQLLKGPEAAIVIKKPA